MGNTSSHYCFSSVMWVSFRGFTVTGDWGLRFSIGGPVGRRTLTDLATDSLQMMFTFLYGSHPLKTPCSGNWRLMKSYIYIYIIYTQIIDNYCILLFPVWCRHSEWGSDLCNCTPVNRDVAIEEWTIKKNQRCYLLLNMRMFHFYWNVHGT